jgi:hypothetical protein
MIDLTQEPPVKLADARHLPMFGRPPSFKTMLRWATHGYAGVTLETVRIGRTLHTSAGAVQRFIERMSMKPTRARPPSQRSRDQRAAEAALDALGIK